MSARLNLFEKGQQGLNALFSVGAYLKKARVEQDLLALVELRVSQINGCAYCLDMHYKDAEAMGMPVQKLYMAGVWKESSVHTAREKAALAWAEAVNAHHVPQEAFDDAKKHFSDEELIDLTLAVAGVSVWNKLNIAFSPLEPGSYATGQHTAA